MIWLIVQYLVSFFVRVIPCRKNRRFENEDVEEIEEVEMLFEHYLDFPFELRMMIIDQMEIKERCRFRRCSRLCNKEAKSSKNYYYSLQFFASNEDDITIYIMYKKNRIQFEEDYSMMIQFIKMEIEQFAMWSTTTKFVECSFYRINKEVWRKKLDKSTDLVEYAAGYFKKLLIENQKYIKHLGINGSLFESKLKDYDFEIEIENLDRLEELSINGSMDVPLYLSKLRRPLRRIWVDGEGDDNLAENEQIYKIREYMSAPRTKFTIEQLLRLSAPVADVDIGDLTEHDIFDFIQSWKNGTIGTERRVYKWMSLRFSIFSVFKLFRLLGKEVYYTVGRGSIEIKHNKEAGNIAKLSYADRFFVKFEVSGKS